MGEITTTVDLSGVGNLINGIHHALIGTGQGGDLADVVKDETRLLAMQISKVPKKTFGRLDKNLRRDIGHVFFREPVKYTIGSSEASEYRWLSAGPKFLLGIDRNFDLTNTGGDLTKMLYDARGVFPKNKTENVGKRGPQHVSLVNRFMIRNVAYTELYKSLRKKIGKRDASFAETAQKLGETRIPAATKKHFPTEKNTTHITELTGPDPSITFGSNAVGVAKLMDKVKRAVAVRRYKMAKKLEHILTGYALDNNSHSRIKKHAKDKQEHAE